MELEHRFELPVGVETAWATLLDMKKIGPCFPGATLDSVDGDAFSGTARIKFGPIDLKYKGKGRIVEKDPVAHRARIEASGNANAASTAAMLVTATATALSAGRTAVDLVTTLSITGRPAKFGRGVMVEMGNKLISQFADAVSTELSGRPAGGAELLNEVNPDEVAAEVAAVTEAHAAGGTQPYRSVAAHRVTGSPQSVNAFSVAGSPLLGRVLTVLISTVVLALVRRALRRR